MAWSKTTFARNGAPCSSCGGMVQKGAEGWTDASQPRGRRVRCLACGPAETVITTSPADPVAGAAISNFTNVQSSHSRRMCKSALRLDRQRSFRAPTGVLTTFPLTISKECPDPRAAELTVRVP